MDTPVVLSHETAWFLHHAPMRRDAIRRAFRSPNDECGLSKPHLTAAQVADRVTRFLLDCGIPQKLLEANRTSDKESQRNARVIHLLVSTAKDRTSSKLIKTHILGRPFDTRLLEHVAPGIFVVNEALNFIQASTWMNTIELLEYGFELCGRYELPLLGTTGPNVECSPRCSLESIRQTLDSLPNIRGAYRARRALARVRGGSRSPMETALALSILLPQKDGGLGYRNISLNQRIQIPPTLKLQCASDHLEAGILAPKRQVDIEYDGDDHADLARRTHDSDRTSVFSALGIIQRTITAQHFAHQLEFHRAMNGIANLLNIDVPKTVEFQRKQNELRLTLIRNWKGRDNGA